MNNKFKELFGGFADETLDEVFSDAEILNVRITMETKTVEIDVLFPCLITKKLNDKADYELARTLGVEAVKINRQHTRNEYVLLAVSCPQFF